MAGCALAGWVGVAAAQTVYKWTDERGTVHFSDSLPSNAKDVEERHLPKLPVVEKPAAPAGASSDAPTEGPGRVILVSRKSPRTAPSAIHFSGQVKNVGGADASRVTVSIVAADSGQENPCLEQQAAVNPSTLHPGETGNFDTEVDSPCLFGDPKIDVTPAWE